MARLRRSRLAAGCSAALHRPRRLQAAPLRRPGWVSSGLLRRQLAACLGAPPEAQPGLQGPRSLAEASLEPERRPRRAPAGRVSSAGARRSRRRAERRDCLEAELRPQGQRAVGACLGVLRRPSPQPEACLEPQRRRARARPAVSLEPNRQGRAGAVCSATQVAAYLERSSTRCQGQQMGYRTFSVQQISFGFIYLRLTGVLDVPRAYAGHSANFLTFCIYRIYIYLRAFHLRLLVQIREAGMRRKRFLKFFY